MFMISLKEYIISYLFMFGKRWKGDYGSKIQMWFPANYVEECIEPRSEYTGPNQQTSLESEQKGTVDIGGCTVGEYQKETKIHPFQSFSFSLFEVTRGQIV